MKLSSLFIVLSLVFLSCDNIKLVREGDKPDENMEASLKKGKELVKINDTTIHEGYLDFLARINPRVKGQINNPASRKKIIDNLVEQELLYQESVKRELDQKEDVLNKAALYRRVVIAQALLEEEMEKKAKEYFEKNKETQFTKVGFSQIQVNFKKPEEEKPAADKDKKEEKKKEETPVTPEEKAEALKKVQEIKARLTAGEDFVKVAEETSDDKSSKKKGGDMGKISRDDKRMSRLGLDALTQAAFTLKKGDVSDPLETAKGYHVIKVTSDVETTPFEEAERVIRMQVQQETKDGLLSALKGSAKINYAEGEKETKKKPEEKVPAENQPAPSEPSASPVPEAPNGKQVPEQPQPAGSLTDQPQAPPMASPPPMAVPVTPPPSPPEPPPQPVETKTAPPAGTP